MSRILVRVLAHIRIAADQDLKIERTDGAYGERSVSLPSGTYRFSEDDSSSDILYQLETLVKAADDSDEGWGTGELDGFTASLNGSNQPVLAMPSGQTATITWSGVGLSAETLRDLLRLTGTTSNIGFPGKVGSRVHAGGWYATWEVTVDKRATRVARGSTRSRTSNKQVVVYYGSTSELTLRFTVEGWERDDEYSEYFDLKDLLLDYMVKGEVVRIHHDTTVNAAYAEVTEPWGYDDVKLISPTDWELDRLLADIADIADVEFVFQVQ